MTGGSVSLRCFCLWCADLRPSRRPQGKDNSEIFFFFTGFWQKLWARNLCMINTPLKKQNFVHSYKLSELYLKYLPHQFLILIEITWSGHKIKAWCQHWDAIQTEKLWARILLESVTNLLSENKTSQKELKQDQKALKQELETLQKKLQQFLEVSQKWLKWFAGKGELSVRVITTKCPNKFRRLVWIGKDKKVEGNNTDITASRKGVTSWEPTIRDEEEQDLTGWSSAPGRNV